MYDESAKTVDPDFNPRNASIGTATRLRSPSVAREKSAIDDEIRVSSQLVELLHSAIGQLEEKVNPVRADYPPSDTDRARREQVGSSQVYHRIYENNEGVNIAVERLRKLTQDLEV